MMHVYFIRHGETPDNASGRIPREDARLSNLGIEQVLETGSILSTAGITAIYSSQLARARQTAEILAKALSIDTIETSGLFNERSLPAILLGARHSDLDVQRIIKEIDTEENYLEFFTRMQDALAEIKKLNDSALLVCTHAGFMKAVLSYVQNNGESNYEEFKKLDQEYEIVGGGILHLSYGNAWKIESLEGSILLRPRSGSLL